MSDGAGGLPQRPLALRDGPHVPVRAVQRTHPGCDTVPYRLPVPDAITLAVAHGLGNTYYDADTLAESIAHTIADTLADCVSVTDS